MLRIKYTEIKTKKDINSRYVCKCTSWFHNVINYLICTIKRWVLLVEQELPTLPEHSSSSQVLVGYSKVFCVVFCRSLIVFFLLLLVTVFSVLLRFMASDYPFRQTFLNYNWHIKDVVKEQMFRYDYKFNSHNCILHCTYIHQPSNTK